MVPALAGVGLQERKSEFKKPDYFIVGSKHTCSLRYSETHSLSNLALKSPK